MDIKTFRAKSMHDALRLVRRELGPDAAVLHTREVRPSGLMRLVGGRCIEVTASRGVNVPSRLPQREQAAVVAGGSMESGEAANRSAAAPRASDRSSARSAAPGESMAPAHLERDYRAKFRDDVKQQLSDLQSMVEQLCQRTSYSGVDELPDVLFRVFTDMIEADVSEELARELLERLRTSASADDLADPALVRTRLARMLEDEIRVTGPIQTIPGNRRLVALIGPTGVGKTTTIAKLAANYRLREKKRVGLITVDTYRIAAVEQLRTYADIIDLPMEVVSTPREMREARQRLANFDLVLVDTAGRSPRDEVRVQELKSMLAEASPDEVHLVLSCVAGSRSLAGTAHMFREAGATALLLTKLDETAGLGNILPLIRTCDLPLSYLTDGQNVPDDIRCASQQELARLILGMNTAGAIEKA